MQCFLDDYVTKLYNCVKQDECQCRSHVQLIDELYASLVNVLKESSQQLKMHLMIIVMNLFCNTLIYHNLFFDHKVVNRLIIIIIIITKNIVVEYVYPHDSIQW
jgi:hypothetical protein